MAQFSENINEMTRKLQRKIYERNALFLAFCITVSVVGALIAVTTQLLTSVAEKEEIITQLRRYVHDASCAGVISGPGLQSTTINHPTHVIIELSHANGQPCSLEETVTAQIRIHSIDQSFLFPTTVTMTNSSRYEVWYTVRIWGQYMLHVQLSGREVKGSPFTIDLTQLETSSSCVCLISGPGLQLTTINYSTHVIVQFRNLRGQPCSQGRNVTAELRIYSVNQSFILPVKVSLKSSSKYEVWYKTWRRGEHKLHVQLDGSEVSNSPFNITVYPNPTQLGTPVKIVTGLNGPWGIAVNSHGNIVVSNYRSGDILLLDNKGKRIGAYGFWGDRSNEIKDPAGVAIDSDDNVYVTSDQKLHIFRRDGSFKKGIQYMYENEKHTFLRGIALHQGYVYVCDRGNYHVVVFNAALNVVKKIGSPGVKMGQFFEPYDLDFDSEGLAYICDRRKHQIQVLNTSGQFVQLFGQEKGEGKLKTPTSVHIMGEFVYVTDHGHDRIAVYHTSGQFITFFGKHGNGEGEFDAPYGITSDKNGFLYVADYNNDRIQVF